MLGVRNAWRRGKASAPPPASALQCLAVFFLLSAPAAATAPQTRQSSEEVGVLQVADDLSNAICTNQIILNTFIRHANEDVTESNKITSITQPGSVYIRGLHDWECRGMVQFEDGTRYWALFGHHPHSSTEYEVFIDEE